MSPQEKRYWIYHKKTCKEGKIVLESEYVELLKNGWVKNPNEFITIIDAKKGKDYQEIVESAVVPRATTEEVSGFGKHSAVTQKS